MGRKIPKLVLTGGPCAGKTTALSILAQKLPEYGVTPFFVPEVATLVINSGLNIQTIAQDPKLYFEFERELLTTQLVLERTWENFVTLEPGNKKVLICDRGAMDPAAYMDSREWKKLISSLDYDETELRDKRYKAVFHLVTAAAGAEEFYNLNNSARHETPEQACATDGRTLAAWNGHPHLRVIPNFRVANGGKERIDFNTKMEILVREVCRALHIPAPLQVGRKYLVELEAEKVMLPIPCIGFDIIQTYLCSNEPCLERRVRVRSEIRADLSRVNPLYTYAEKKKLSSGVWQKKERIVSREEYERLLAQANPALRRILKTRYSFAYEHQYFQLDVFSSPVTFAILEVELTEAAQEVLLPPFVKIVKDVTDDAKYSNFVIASPDALVGAKQSLW